jgi:hypothetical protein
MSQQINLYEARLRPRHELATGRNVGVALGVLLAMVVALSFFVRYQAGRVTAEYVRLQAEVTVEQEKVTALNKALVERKISPALQAELDNTKALLATRKEVIEYLDSGRLGNNTGFSGLMLGFARLAYSDLWLTGFSVSQGGQEIEIRGSMLDSTKLPGYVQRLSAEPVFQGRRFDALTMQSVDPAEAKPETASGLSAPASPAAQTVPRLPRHVDFVLRSEHAGELVSAVGGKK